MKVKFLAQGIHKSNNNSVGSILMTLLQDDRFDTFVGISAFASYLGVNGLAKYISDAKKHLNRILIVVGIDQKGTSKEALQALECMNVDSYVYYQSSFPIFHPKIYLLEGPSSAVVIIGSSNMTTQGLFANSEASVLIELDKKTSEDSEFLQEIRSDLELLLAQKDDNMKRINVDLINKLVDSGIVPNEIVRQKTHDAKEGFHIASTRVDISELFPASKNIPKIPIEFRRSVGLKIKSLELSTNQSVVSETDGQDGQLVWISSPLKERDLNIPTGANTSATGSMSLTKGELENVDQRHYFREIVFSALEWNRDSAKGREHFERAYANFTIYVDNINYGTYNLRLSHNTRTDTPSYRQGNYMTHVSWGKAKSIIAKPELLGKKAYLYRLPNNDFLLKIE